MQIMGTRKTDNRQTVNTNEPPCCFRVPDPGPPLTFTKVRRMSLLIAPAILMGLVAYQFLFSPSPTLHPFIMKSLDEAEVLRALNWYGKNSLGSLQLPLTDICMFKNETSKRGKSADEAAPALLPTSNPTCSSIFKNDVNIRSLVKAAKEDPELRPYIWRDSDGTINIALFTSQAENLISFKKENSILGPELDVHAMFKRISLSPIVDKLREIESGEDIKSAIGSLEQLIGIEFSQHTRLKKYQSGYYLPVFPLP